MKVFDNILKATLLVILVVAFANPAKAQVVLEANGPGDTYELINSVLAPGYNAVENPECVHPEFGRHITEVWDEDLKQFVFEFHIHVTPDNDRCLYFDRQRMEIKTYESSPAILKGISGETVIYKWKFKIPEGFKPSSSFTHIHQIKAVGGDDDMPIITLTPRAGNPNKMELIHNNTTKVVTVPLSLFEGQWVEVTERIKIDSKNGTFSMVIKTISDDKTILSYSNENIMTIRADNSFIRPKWGIYRSLNAAASLRDESMRFAGFSIEEVLSTSVIKNLNDGKSGLTIYPNPVTKMATVDYRLSEFSDVKLSIHNLNGQIMSVPISTVRQEKGTYSKVIDLSGYPEGLYLLNLSSGNFSETQKLWVKH